MLQPAVRQAPERVALQTQRRKGDLGIFKLRGRFCSTRSCSGCVAAITRTTLAATNAEPMALKGTMPLTALHHVAGAGACCAPYLQGPRKQAAAAALQRQGQQGQARVLITDGLAGDGLR